MHDPDFIDVMRKLFLVNRMIVTSDNTNMKVNHRSPYFILIDIIYSLYVLPWLVDNLIY